MLLIIESHISQSPNDKQEITLSLVSLNELPEQLGEIDTILTDVGYCSDANAVSCRQSPEWNHIFRHIETSIINLYPVPPPEDAEPIEKMRYKLKTAEGRKVYSVRKSKVEPVFGIIKHVLGFRQFFLRGPEAVSGEWTFVPWHGL